MANARARRASANIRTTIRQDYFHWLCDVVNVTWNRDPYWLLAGYLHSLEFEPGKIAKDGNRAADGVYLRETYISTVFVMGTCPVEEAYNAIDGPCTMLEFLVALAQRFAFQIEDLDEGIDRVPGCFWEMCHNLGLDEYNDDVFAERDGPGNCWAIVRAVLDRRYQPNGYGGIFPLDNPRCDQRKNEIWNQMQEYVIEKY